MELLKYVIVRPLVLFFTQVAGGRPVGTWVAWVGLAYATLSALNRVCAFQGGGAICAPMTQDLLVVWPCLVIATIALAFRRASTILFGGISMAFLLYFSLGKADWLGVAIALTTIVALLSIRRWYVERLPSLR